ncbi:MAG TPA: hypothetical protein VMU51_36180 [Mycobacteriales bacterium]|nr:hypothetical protein [Mycobacteriales bacterium]
MPAPGLLLDLALTLHPAHPAQQQDQQAVLASRLGYAEVWLPVDAAYGFPGADRLAGLARAAGPARLGLLITGTEPDVIGGLLRQAGGPGTAALIELVGVPAGPALVHAVGGAQAWRARVRLPAFDPTAAGTVVAAPTRPDSLTGIAVAAAQRAAAGLAVAAHPVVAALPVSIGRTLNEAEARAGRGPGSTSGTGDARDSGLFGTYEQAQIQVLELAAAGADALRVTVPDEVDEVDVADLLAQVRSVVVGATPAHVRRN